MLVELGLVEQRYGAVFDALGMTPREVLISNDQRRAWVAEHAADPSILVI